MRLTVAVVVAVLTSWLTPIEAGEITSVNEPADGPVRRVATLDFMTTEIAALLGRDPVAIAGLGHYRDWVGIGADALADAHDLGRRAEPDLETLAAAEPDLITGATFRHEPLVDGLSRIAPVALYNWLPNDTATDPLQHLRRVVRHMGQRLDRAQRAAQLLQSMDDSLAEQRARLEEGGRSGTPIVLAQHVSGTNRFNLYTDRTPGVAIAKAIGLTNAWQGDADKFGYKPHGLETLLTIEDAHLILVAQPGDNAFKQLTDSPVWQSLPAVQANRVHRLPPKTWLYGGPETASRIARQIADALLED